MRGVLALIRKCPDCGERIRVVETGMWLVGTKHGVSARIRVRCGCDDRAEPGEVIPFPRSAA